MWIKYIQQLPHIFIIRASSCNMLAQGHPFAKRAFISPRLFLERCEIYSGTPNSNVSLCIPVCVCLCLHKFRYIGYEKNDLRNEGKKSSIES